MRPVPSELVRGEGCRGLVRCLVVGCFACGAGGGLSRFSVLLGGWKFRLVRRVFRMRPQGVSPDALRSEARRGGASG